MVITIFDLDNCISDDINRHHLLPNYDKYHNACYKDKLDLTGIQKVPEKFVIFTGRPEIYKSETLDWLRKHNLFPQIVFMRPAGNYLSNPALKREFLYLLPIYMPLTAIDMAYDDRQDVLDMYSEFRIPTTLKRIPTTLKRINNYE